MSRESRREKLRELMDQNGLKALLLQRPANFAWYTNGVDNRVDHDDPLGVAAILLTTGKEYVVTNNIEAPRLREEETSDFEVLEHPWYGDPLRFVIEIVDGAPFGADYPLEGVSNLSEEIAPLRYVLDKETTDRYRQLGADATAAIEEAAASLEPRMDEHETAANLAASCQRRGLFTPVLIAAGEKRISRYRHPIPHDGSLGSRAMLAVCAERGGLYANLTRTVHFNEPGIGLRRCQEACGNVLLRTREATVPGRKLSDVFEDCRRFYSEEGFPGEWRKHHQGGLTGYGSREVIATPETEIEIQSGMAFAWNPSVSGAKAEETFMLIESGLEVITGT